MKKLNKISEILRQFRKIKKIGQNSHKFQPILTKFKKYYIMFVYALIIYANKYINKLNIVLIMYANKKAGNTFYCN